MLSKEDHTDEAAQQLHHTTYYHKLPSGPIAKHAAKVEKVHVIDSLFIMGQIDHKTKEFLTLIFQGKLGSTSCLKSINQANLVDPLYLLKVPRQKGSCYLWITF